MYKHKQFDTILKVLQSNKRVNKNIMLVGPAGSSKTTTAKQVAEDLKLDFYPMSVGIQTTKSDLIGFINAKGEYISTPVREAFEKGGLLLLDEFDCGNAGVVTILNTLLSNDFCSFPDKKVLKHKNFICICACNTYGKGGDLDYIGRNRLDVATLDRFVTIKVDYDETLEDKIVQNAEWTKIIRQMRDNIKKSGAKVIISPRASLFGADLLDNGFGIEEVLDMVVYKGVSADIKKQIIQNVDLSSFLKKQKKVKKNVNRPIKIWLDFNLKIYKLIDIDSDTSILKGIDWDGATSIYLSTTNGFNSKLDKNALYLNYSHDGTLEEPTQSNIDNFIRDLSTYSESACVESQPIHIKIHWKDDTYEYILG